MVVAIVSVLLLMSAGLAAWHGIRLYRSIHRSRAYSRLPASKERPSVSICVPARNEMHAMAQCLERLLASDYEKLEIIVFDDNSADDTSVIIRSFAQAGVRFVAGTDLPEGWLGKNFALDVMAREASGTYVIFMDVDTAITPTTVSRLVDAITNQEKDMISVIPQRADGWRLSVLFGHLRYFWELSLDSAARPASASALWMIRRGLLLDEFGGLSAYRATTAPESAIAANLGVKRYESLVSSDDIEVLYEKKWLSQVETSKRLLYPRANSTWLGAIQALISLLFLNLPLFVVLSSFVIGWGTVQVLALLCLAAGMLVYGIYTHATWRHLWWLGVVVWPLVIFQELLLFINSLQGYYRHTITWKGRPVSPQIPNKTHDNRPTVT